MSLGRRVVPWYAWFAVVFVLFNSCAGHRETWETGEWLNRGPITVGPSLAIRALRAACNDDGNINRYLAYADAVLGRPYQAYYVRPMEVWKAEPIDEAKDYNDPSVVAPVRPTAPVVPYRDFSVEYPPGFFPVAMLPVILSSDMDVYRAAFSVWMAILLTLSLWLMVKTALEVAPDRAETLVQYASWAALSAGVILVRRYDAIVAVSLCAVVWGCLARKPVVVGLGLGIGVAAKLVPALVAPLALAYWITRKRWREGAIALTTAMGTVAALCAPFVLTAGSRVLDLFAYHAGRPLEIESTGGALLIVSRFVSPVGVTLSKAFGSDAAVASWDAPLKTGSGVVLFLALLGVVVWAVLQLRSEPDDRASVLILARASCALMTAWMVFGKVLSPQYLTWLVPLGIFVSVVDGRRSSRLFLGVLALTQLIYPFAFKAGPFAESLNPWFGVLILLRNALLFMWGLSLLRARPLVGAPGIERSSPGSTGVPGAPSPYPLEP
jgi:Glycosyltransferase family 87